MGGAIDAPQNVNIPRGWLEFRIENEAKSRDTPIVLYCGGGLRSTLAADTLRQMGYVNVMNYNDGFLGWQKAGLPVK
jgi:rhodanese-related sulfurtransferase